MNKNISSFFRVRRFGLDRSKTMQKLRDSASDVANEIISSGCKLPPGYKIITNGKEHLLVQPSGAIIHNSPDDIILDSGNIAPGYHRSDILDFCEDVARMKFSIYQDIQTEDN